MSLESIKTSEMDFPRTYDIDAWNRYLSQRNMKLDEKDLDIIENAMNEKRFNKRVEKLFENGQKHKLYIPALTNLYGNCLFESLEYHKMIDDPNEFREDIAYIMYMFGEIEYFFPDQKESLKTLFSLYNEIETVICRDTMKTYKYDYNTMCKDLASDYSWTRLNTELVMRVMAHIFGRHFVVLNIEDHNKVLIYYPNSNYSYVDEIPDEVYNSTETIYLGLIGEVHYIPLEYSKEKVNEFPKYMNRYNKFIEWARMKYFIVHYEEYKPLFDKLLEENEEK